MLNFMKVLKPVIILVAFVFFQHCTKPVDFDQIDNANVQVSFITTLIHLNITASDFLNEFNDELPFISDAVKVPIGDAIEPYIRKIEFTILAQNSFDRIFTLSFVFLDEFNSPIYTLKPTITVPAHSSELLIKLEIPDEETYVIYQTRSIETLIVLLPSNDGNVIHVNETSFLNLKSSMKLYVNYRKT